MDGALQLWRQVLICVFLADVQWGCGVSPVGLIGVHQVLVLHRAQVVVVVIVATVDLLLLLLGWEYGSWIVVVTGDRCIYVVVVIARRFVLRRGCLHLVVVHVLGLLSGLVPYNPVRWKREKRG